VHVSSEKEEETKQSIGIRSKKKGEENNTIAGARDAAPGAVEVAWTRYRAAEARIARSRRGCDEGRAEIDIGRRPVGIAVTAENWALTYCLGATTTTTAMVKTANAGRFSILRVHG
jgi:hypothetical protein